MTLARNRATMAATVVICGMLVAFAGDGIRAYFTPDDMMNLYGAWAHGLRQADRPVGTLVYQALFSAFGFNPLPYRITAFTLLIANLGLLYAFCARLARSREAAVLACLLGAYQARLADLYYSTGTIYDLLCYFFFFLAFVWYLRIRDAGALPNWRQSAALLGLYVLALGSKEIAVTLPVVVAVYEWIYHGRKEWPRWRFVWAGLPLAAFYTLYKTIGARAMTSNADYRPDLSLHAFLSGWKHYLGDLLYGAPLNSFWLAALFAGLLAAALIARRRELLFGWFFVLIAALPVVFIPPRGLFAAYLTLPGWFLCASSVLILSRDGLIRYFPRFAALFRVRPEQAALFLAVAALLVPLHRRARPQARAWVPEAHATVRNVIDSLAARYPTMPRGARVLILNDPYPKDEWMLTFIFRLFYRDDGIRVDRAKVWPELAEEPARSTYQRAFVVDENGLREQLP